MKKYIPSLLLAHYQQQAVTTCLLTRIKTKDGELQGYTDLDVDIEYDPAVFDPGGTGDDWGPLVHKASNGGATLAQLQASANLSVDNSEVKLLPGTESISVAQALAGEYDSADVRFYRVNYMDLSMGHECVAVGRLGNCRISGQVVIVEYRSLMQLLKEPESDLYSIPCAHVFGKAPKCPKAYTWTDGEVLAVDPSDALRIFGSDLDPENNFYVPGVVEWLTGDNAGRQMEVDQNTAGSFALALPMIFAIQIGDTFRVRQDCSKVWSDDEHGCKYHWPDDRRKYFGGFPDIPVADGGVAMIPGGQVGAREED